MLRGTSSSVKSFITAASSTSTARASRSTSSSSSSSNPKKYGRVGAGMGLTILSPTSSDEKMTAASSSCAFQSVPPSWLA